MTTNRLTPSESQRLSERVVHFYSNVANSDRSATIGHFLAEGYKKRTLNNIFDRLRKRGSADHLPKPGRSKTEKRIKITDNVKKQLLSCKMSQREIAYKHGCSQQMVKDIKEEMIIKTKRCKSAPRYVKDQAKRAKTNSRKVSELLGNKVLVMDDESYVPVDPENIPGQSFFNFIDESEVPKKLKIKPKDKFPDKFLVWQAIDECGNVSEPYITMGIMDRHEYKSECLQKRLLPFIEQYHSKADVLFWPDLAQIHYAKDCQNWLKEVGIECVPKQMNPPNLPQARPIEQFWAICKQIYKKRPKRPKSLSGFRRVWKKISSEVAKTDGQNLMRGVRSKIRNIGRNGVYTLF